MITIHVLMHRVDFGKGTLRAEVLVVATDPKQIFDSLVHDVHVSYSFTLFLPFATHPISFIGFYVHTRMHARVYMLTR